MTAGLLTLLATQRLSATSDEPLPPPPPPPPPDPEPGDGQVVIGMVPYADYIAQGTSKTVVTRIVRGSGVTGVVTITPGALPTGITVSAITPIDDERVSISFVAAAGAVRGWYDVTIYATGAGILPTTTSFRLVVVNAGAYAHLAPLTLPPEVAPDGIPYSFDSTTGRMSGTVWDTSWITRAWLIANADTVVTVKATGGDYGPTQLQTALDDAASANDVRVIVVDSALELTNTSLSPRTFRYKADSYEEANLTALVSSDWWDGTWNPTGDRYLTIRDGHEDDETPHLFILNSRGPTSTGTQTALSRETGAYKNVVIGAWIRKAPNNTGTDVNGRLLNMTAPDSGGFLLRWSMVDGAALTEFNETTGTMKVISKLAQFGQERNTIENSLVFGNGIYSGENNAIFAIGGRWLTIRNSLVEGQSINILFGGAEAAPGNVIRDIEIHRVFSIKNQRNNRSSSKHFGAFAIPRTGRPNKQHIEVKHGIRGLIHECILDTSFQGGQSGAGISIQNTGTAVQGNIITNNWTILHNYIVRCKAPLNVTTSGPNTNRVLNPRFNEWTFVANCAMGYIRADHNEGPYVDGEVMSMSSFGSGEPEEGTFILAGPYFFKNLSWVTANPAGGITSARDFTLLRVRPERKYVFSLTDSILPGVWTATFGGINPSSSTSPVFRDFRLLPESELYPGAIQWARNATPLGIARMTRDAPNGAETRFPDQYAPEALWQPQGWNAFGFTTLVDDPYACNLTLDDASPVKGLGEDGRDPGCNWSLLRSLTIDAGVRNYAPELLDNGMPNFAMFVEFV